MMRAKCGFKVIFNIIVTCYVISLLAGCGKETVSSNSLTLVINPTVISDSTTVYTTPQHAVTFVYLTSNGDGILTYTATGPDSSIWLSIGKKGGSAIDTITGLAPDTLWVQMSVGALSVGEYIDTIYFTSPQAVNSPQYVEVSLVVTSKIITTPTYLNFVAVRGLNPPAPQLLTITAEHNAESDFTLSSSSSWLSCDHQSGSVPDEIIVTADHTGLSVGLYLDTIMVTSPQSASVSMVPCSLTVSSWEVIEHPHEQGLRAITFMDDIHGWMVGNVGGSSMTGYVLATVDGGETWERQDLDQLDHMLGDVQFLDTQTGYAVGKYGYIIKTIDGGSNWVAQNPPDTLDLNSVHFTDASAGWAVGRAGYIVHTTNGGDAWSLQNSNTSLYLSGVQFVSIDSGWIVGDAGLILFTDDGGATWNSQVSGVSKDLKNLKFLSNTTGWIVGLSGTILYTDNAGITWTSIGPYTNAVLYDLSFAPSGKVWAVGSSGTVLFSEDGFNWINQPSGVNDDLFGVYFHNDTDGWAVGNNGIIIHTRVGGL